MNSVADTDPDWAQVSLRRKNSNRDSSNNSDASGSCSIGSNSFAFNFDAAHMATDEAMMNNEQRRAADEQAADVAVASLASIATSYSKEVQVKTAEYESNLDYSLNSIVSFSNKGATSSNSSSFADDDRPLKRGKKAVAPAITEDVREERNAREKERSFRISRQINEIRNLLSSGGVIVPKGTKSSVLTEAASYIRMLQQHQYRSEIDRHQLIKQIQAIGSGAHGPEAAQTVRHVAAQNGVWSLGNFGGVPPTSAMSHFESSQAISTMNDPEERCVREPDHNNFKLQTNVDDDDCRLIFNSCSVGMAIASMGGALIDCNHLFTQLSNYSKQEVCSMTIFNLTSHHDLQNAFDLISQMISPSPLGRKDHVKPRPCVLRGSMKNRNDLGLSVALIRGDDDVAKCFCVTLIKNPTSSSDTSQPVPATADLVQIISHASKEETFYSSPAYTTG